MKVHIHELYDVPNPAVVKVKVPKKFRYPKFLRRAYSQGVGDGVAAALTTLGIKPRRHYHHHFIGNQLQICSYCGRSARERCTGPQQPEGAQRLHDSVQAFDKFRDDHPHWEQLTPYEISAMFWRAGEEHARG